MQVFLVHSINNESKSQHTSSEKTRNILYPYSMDSQFVVR